MTPGDLQQIFCSFHTQFGSQFLTALALHEQLMAHSPSACSFSQMVNILVVRSDCLVSAGELEKYPMASHGGSASYFQLILGSIISLEIVNIKGVCFAFNRSSTVPISNQLWLVSATHSSSIQPISVFLNEHPWISTKKYYGFGISWKTVPFKIHMSY